MHFKQGARKSRGVIHLIGWAACQKCSCSAAILRWPAQEPLTEAGEELDTVDIGKQLERVKWFLWHGNVGRALDTIG